MHLKAGRDVVLRVELHAALFQLSRVADHIANLDRIIDGCLQILDVIEESGGVELEGAKIAAQADFATLDRDRQSVVEGRRVSVRVDLGGGGLMNKKKKAKIKK